MIVLGIHGGVTIRQHEAAAALLVDGQIAAVCEEERYTRYKGAYGLLPTRAIRACLEIAGLTMADVDLVVSPGETYEGFDETLRTYLRHEFGFCPPIHRVHHQLAHAATAFYGSGRPDAACLVLDASGDGISGMICHGDRENGLQVVGTVPNENSIGFFYTLMTYFLGYGDGDEYKVMGLAPYGESNIDLSQVIRPDGDSWRFEPSFLRSDPGPKSPSEATYSGQLQATLGQPPRVPGGKVLGFHKNLAASTQKAFESCLLNLVGSVSRDTGSNTLCFAGGVALNCAANLHILESGHFENFYVPPVASDRGLALGCAYLGAIEAGDSPAPIDHAYLGSGYDDELIETELKSNGINYKPVDDPAQVAAKQIAEGRIVGLFQGRSEAGARALGNRSILALPGGLEFKDQINARIKYRESFRPFAPAVNFEKTTEHFDTGGRPSPYMSVTFHGKNPKADSLGTVVHVDGTARLQTVHAETNPLLHSLIEELDKHTGTPVVLNTSFNLKGQPIVESPRDALMTFFGCGLDDLFIGNYWVPKRRWHE